MLAAILPLLAPVHAGAAVQPPLCGIHRSATACAHLPAIVGRIHAHQKQKPHSTPPPEGNPSPPQIVLITPVQIVAIAAAPVVPLPAPAGIAFSSSEIAPVVATVRVVTSFIAPLAPIASALGWNFSHSDGVPGLAFVIAPLLFLLGAVGLTLARRPTLAYG